MISLSPSILSADFSVLGNELMIVEKAGLTSIHIDVMDGNFVPNITIGPAVIKSLRSKSNLIFDVHLMIEHPERHIQSFYEAGADIITVHPESCYDLYAVIQQIKSLGIKVGVAFNPATSIAILNYIVEVIDRVVIMSVCPGFGGQTLITDIVYKIGDIARVKLQSKLKFDIEIDGGVNLENLSTLIEAGAEIIVAGSSIYKKNKTANNIKEFLNIIDDYNIILSNI